jgi:hypothetical protein
VKKAMTKTGYDSLGAVVGLTDKDLQEIEKEGAIILAGHKKVLKTMAFTFTSLGLANLNKIHHLCAALS